MVDVNKPGRATLSWWQMILGIDLFLVVVTVLTRYSVQFPGRGRLGNHFNLAVNGGVWWSGAGLLALALMAYELYCRNEEKAKAAWLVLSVVLAGLSLDEIGSIHERVSGGVDRGWFDLLPYGAILVSLVTYAVIVLFRNEKTKWSSLYIAAAFFVFGGVALQEHLENIVSWPAWSLGVRMGVEEGSELLGAFLLFLAIIPHRFRDGGRSLREAIPDPFSMKHLPQVVLIGFVLHSLASILAPRLIDITEKGNPLAWYPIAFFFLLFSAAFWKRLDSREKSGNWPAMAPLLSFLFRRILLHASKALSRSWRGPPRKFTPEFLSLHRGDRCTRPLCGNSRLLVEQPQLSAGLAAVAAPLPERYSGGSVPGIRRAGLPLFYPLLAEQFEQLAASDRMERGSVAS